MIKNFNWVIEEVPQDHKEMIFFSPDCRGYGFYFSKDVFMASILNDPSDSFYSILKVLRDNNNLFFKKLDKVNFSLKNLNLEKQKKTFKNDVEKAINNYILSKSIKSKKENNKIIIELKELSKKINKDDTFIYNYNLIESLSLFNSENLFVYYSPSLKDIKNKNHSKLIEVLIKHHGKIIIHTYENKLYKKYFKDWNKKKKPDQKNKVRIECIWKNF